MEKKPAISWESMCRFLEQNRGLIVNICRQYRVNPDDTPHLQEDAYMDAVNSYDPSKPTKKYTLANHFGNIFKSKVKQDVLQSSRTVYLEDLIIQIDNVDHENTHYCRSMTVDISGQKQWTQNDNENGHDLEVQRELIAIIRDSAKKRGKGTYKKVLNYILIDDMQSAIEVIPECREVILKIAERRKKR